MKIFDGGQVNLSTVSSLICRNWKETQIGQKKEIVQSESVIANWKTEIC